MLTSFVLAMALAAPVPAPTPPVASGPLPRLLELKGDAEGKVKVTVLRTEYQKVTVTTVAPGGGVPVTEMREVPVSKMAIVELGDVKDLKVTTADGKKVETADAVKALKGGATVVVSADGKPVSPNHLKLFKDDVLVLAAPELVVPTAGPGFGPRPLPAPAIAVPGAAGGIQILPAVPAQPAVPPVAPKPEK